MNSKSKKKFVSFFLVTLLITFSISELLASSSNTLSIPKITKQESDWCWVATSVSIMSYSGITLTQNSFCENAIGDVINRSADDWEVSNGLYHSAFNNRQRYTSLSFSEVVSEINSNKPFYAGISWYSNNGVQLGGHAVAVNGYYSIAGGQYIRYMEPDTGTYHAMFYPTFKGGISENRHWDGTIDRIIWNPYYGS